MNAQRALLDALMGKDRDLARNEKPKGRVTFADANVCKHHLVGRTVWLPRSFADLSRLLP